MTDRHTAHFQVRSFDVDAWGEVPPSTLAAYLEQTAWEHSAALGFGPDWYEARGTAWVIHRLRLARLAPIGYQDWVAATTWVAAMGRVRAERSYEVRNAADQLLAAGRADWAYINRARLAPTPVDPAILAIFPAGERVALPEPPPADPRRARRAASLCPTTPIATTPTQWATRTTRSTWTGSMRRWPRPCGMPGCR